MTALTIRLPNSVHQKTGDPLHNFSRPAIDRTRAVCCVEFLANSRAIGCKIRLAAHPDPIYADSR